MSKDISGFKKSNFSVKTILREKFKLHSELGKIAETVEIVWCEPIILVFLSELSNGRHF